MNILSICIVTVFALWGFAQCIKSLVLFFTQKSGPAVNSVLLIPIDGTCEQAEYILRSAAEDFKWTKHNPFKKIICLCTNTDLQTKRICETVCSEYSFMEFYEETYFHPDIFFTQNSGSCSER